MAEPDPLPPPVAPPRLGELTLRPDGRLDVDRVGVRRSISSDLFHTLMTTSWTRLIGAGFFLWMGLNLLFALLFLVDRGGIANARPGDFVDHFAFAVQTSATIGYGAMAPADLYTHALVAVLSFCATLYTACLTGVVVAKFARPTARVLFTDRIVIAERDGKRSLQLRLANERGNVIVEARARLAVLIDATGPDGERMRRIHDLALLRNETPNFALTWLITHPIDEASPLWNLDADGLARTSASFLLTLTGLDETLGQTVHARKAWSWRDVAWNHRYVDVISERPDGGRRIDYTKFHDIEPLRPRS